MFNFIADIITLPITVPIEALKLAIKATEAAPELVETCFEKIEDALDEVGK